MSDDRYGAMDRMSGSAALRGRLAACAAEQGADCPEQWVWDNIRHLVAVPVAPPLWEKWVYAEAAGRLDPGAAPDVLTDDDLLRAVQHVLGMS